jgi:hypothetical protein
MAFLAVLLPMSLANYWSGDFFVPRWQQALIDVVLVVLGSTAAIMLSRFRSADVGARVLKAVGLFLLVMESVAVPGIYAILWILNWQKAISSAHSRDFGPGWISAVAALGALVVSVLTYRRANTPSPASSKLIT